MKMIKKTIAVISAIFMAGAVFAQQSGTNRATAETIATDADKFMDVNAWSSSEFEKSFGYAQVGIQSDLALGFASKTLLPVYFAAYYYGDLWAENPYNSISLLVGTGDLGIKAGFRKYTQTGIDLYNLRTQVGYNALDGKLGVNGLFSFTFGETSTTVLGTTTTTRVLEPTAQVGAMYEVLKKDAMTLSAGGDFSFSSYNITTVSTLANTTSRNQSISFGPKMEFSYNFGDILKYGMTASIPFTFNDSIAGDSTVHDHRINFHVNNGISANLIKDKLKLNAGIETTLPSINIDDDGEANGNLSNAYYVGLCLNLADRLSIDASAKIFNGSNSVSMNNVWNTGFSFTASMKF